MASKANRLHRFNMKKKKRKSWKQIWNVLDAGLFWRGPCWLSQARTKKKEYTVGKYNKRQSQTCVQIIDMSQLSLSILTWTDTNFKVTRGLCIFRTQQRKEERRESNRTMLTSSSKPADPIDLFSFLCSIHVQSACLIICFLYPLLAKVPHNSISDTPLSSTLTHVHKSWWLLQEAFLEHFFFSFSHWLALVAKAPNFSIYFFIYFQGWKRRRRRRAQLWTPLRVGQLAFLDSNEGKETNWVKRWGKSCVSVNFRTERHPATPYHFPPPPTLFGWWLYNTLHRIDGCTFV